MLNLFSSGTVSDMILVFFRVFQYVIVYLSVKLFMDCLGPKPKIRSEVGTFGTFSGWGEFRDNDINHFIPSNIVGSLAGPCHRVRTIVS